MERKYKQIKDWMTNSIISFVNTSSENSLKDENNEKAWDKPLIAFSNGNDPLYKDIQSEIGNFYWTPAEIFNISFPESNVRLEQLNIICWILPQTEKTKGDNRKQTKYPAERWVRSRLFGEEFNNIVRQFVVSLLTKSGYKAVAPVLSPLWEWIKNEKHGYTSNWSERHVAFISGLGTFGLCDGLITSIGKAVRIGSVVTNAILPPTERPYTDYHEYCLYYSDECCIECAKRCPAGAISKKGHDKVRCRNYIHRISSEYERLYKLRQPACGLCQTNVPCESSNPIFKD